MRAIMMLAAAVLGTAAMPAVAECLTDGEVEAAVGQSVAARAPTIDTARLQGRPLCSGLTLAQAIQRMRAERFPEEGAQDAALNARLAAADAARPLPRNPTPQPDYSRPNDRRTVVVVGDPYFGGSYGSYGLGYGSSRYGYGSRYNYGYRNYGYGFGYRR